MLFKSQIAAAALVVLLSPGASAQGAGDGISKTTYSANEV